MRYVEQGSNILDSTDDEVLQALLKPSSNDTVTCKLLKLICEAVLQDCERQLADHLPEGKFSSPTSQLRVQAQSCNNNICGERVFGQLDHAVKRAPNAKTAFHESKIMYVNNKTHAWLEERSNQNKELFAKVRRVAAQNRAQNKVRDKKTTN